MDFALTPELRALRNRARRFTIDVLQPVEAAFERDRGVLPGAEGNELRRAAIAADLHAGSLPRAVGGQGWSVMEQVIVHEQFGQVTGGLWSYVPGAYNVLLHCDSVSGSATSTPRSEASAPAAMRSPSGMPARTRGRWPPAPSSIRPPLSTS